MIRAIPRVHLSVPSHLPPAMDRLPDPRRAHRTRGRRRHGSGGGCAAHAVLLSCLSGQHESLGRRDFTEFDPISNTGYSARVDQAVARVPGVARPSTSSASTAPCRCWGTIGGQAFPARRRRPSKAAPTGSTYHGQGDRGPGPAGPTGSMDEIDMSSGAAARTGCTSAPPCPWPFFTTRADGPLATSPAIPQSKPYLVVPFKLVGIIEAPPQVVEDDDAALGDQLAVVTPALTKRLEACCAYYTYIQMFIPGSPAHQSAVVSALNKVIPNLGPVAGTRPGRRSWRRPNAPSGPRPLPSGSSGSSRRGGPGDQRPGDQPPRAAEQQRQCGHARPGSRARHGHGRQVLRRLGAVVAGSLLAMAVAVALSPLAPFGPVRPVYPGRCLLRLDRSRLRTSFFIVVLTAAALLVAYRVAPHRLAAKATSPYTIPPGTRPLPPAGLPPERSTGSAIRPWWGRRGRGTGAIGALGGRRRHRRDRCLHHVRRQPQCPRVAARRCTGGIGTMPC